MTFRYYPLAGLHVPNGVAPFPGPSKEFTVVRGYSNDGPSAHGVCFDGRYLWVVVDKTARQTSHLTKIDPISEAIVSDVLLPFGTQPSPHDIEYIGGGEFLIMTQNAAGATHGHVLRGDGSLLRHEYIGPFAAARYHGAAFDGRNLYLCFASAFQMWYKVIAFVTGTPGVSQQALDVNRIISGAAAIEGGGVVYTGGNGLVFHGDTENLLSGANTDIFYRRHNRVAVLGDGISVVREPGPSVVPGTIVNSIAWDGRCVITMETNLV